MSVKIAGCWERGWDTAWQEYNWWVHPLKEFGISEFYMNPITGISKSNVIEFNNILEIINSVTDHTCVYLDESATTNLVDFVHPTNALYIIGRTSYSPYVAHFRPGIDQAVKIPSLANNGGFWGHQVATMILYDRYVKEL